jgi:steroid Delta-isomerase
MKTTPLPLPPPRPPQAADARTARVIAFYESLTPHTLRGLDTLYAQDARFIDPFNDATGLVAIRGVFEHMFATLDSASFEVTEAVTEGEQCFLIWNFHLRRRGAASEMTVHGARHLRYTGEGRVGWHRDYWDPAREVYESVPVLGSVLRWLRRRLSAGA